jgi:hypothetical protein
VTVSLEFNNNSGSIGIDTEQVDPILDKFRRLNLAADDMDVFA